MARRGEPSSRENSNDSGILGYGKASNKVVQDGGAHMLGSPRSPRWQPTPRLRDELPRAAKPPGVPVLDLSAASRREREANRETAGHANRTRAAPGDLSTYSPRRHMESPRSPPETGRSTARSSNLDEGDGSGSPRFRAPPPVVPTPQIRRESIRMEDEFMDDEPHLQPQWAPGGSARASSRSGPRASPPLCVSPPLSSRGGQKSPRNKISTSEWSRERVASRDVASRETFSTLASRETSRPGAQVKDSAPVRLSLDSGPPPSGADKLLHASVLSQILGEHIQSLLQSSRRETQKALREELDQAYQRHGTAYGKREAASPKFGTTTDAGRHVLPTTLGRVSLEVDDDAEELLQARRSPRAPQFQSENSRSRSKGSRADFASAVDDITTSWDRDKFEMKRDPTASKITCYHGSRPRETAMLPTLAGALDDALHQHRCRCCGRIATWLEQKVSVLGTVNAPRYDDMLSLFVDTDFFAVCVGLVILFNVVFMVIAANQEIENYKSEPSEFVQAGEIGFLGFYALEFLLRVYRFGLYYWVDEHWKWNWLDFGLLISSFYFVLLQSVLPKLSWLRMLRILRVVKVLRVFRLVAMFKKLRAILVSLMSTVGTLFWSLVMVYIILFIFGLVFTLLVGTHFRSKGASLGQEEEENLNSFYGSVNLSILTLYMSITGGIDWSNAFEALVPTGEFSCLVFLFFIFFLQIAVLNIILGLFVEQALESVKANQLEAAHMHGLQAKNEEQEITNIISSADLLGDGKLSKEDWEATLRRGHVSSYMDLIGFRAADVMEYYKELSKESADGKVDLQHFIDGCLCLRGSASRYDVHHIHRELVELRDLIKNGNR